MQLNCKNSILLEIENFVNFYLTAETYNEYQGNLALEIHNFTFIKYFYKI